MKILLLTLYFAPDVGANAVIMTELAEELAKAGHDLTIITSMPHYSNHVVDKEYRGRLFIRDEHKGIRVIRTYLYTSPDKMRFIVRFLNYISFNLLSTLAGIFVPKHDVILSASPPLTVGLSAFIIGFLKRTPYVYNVQDIYPDVVVKLKILTNSLGITISRWLERFVYRYARYITVLSDGFKENLLGKGVPERKIRVIPNFVDIDFIKPMPDENGFRKDLDLEECFLILYAGNLGHSQDLDTVLECAGLLSEKQEIRFLIVGNGSRKPYLEEKSDRLGLSKVIFLPFQPWEKVPQLYAAADLSLIPLKKEIALYSVPSKAYTIMASSRPIVASAESGSDIWHLIREADCGLCLNPEDPQSMAESILALHADPSLRERLGANGRRYVAGHFTRQVAGKKYHQLLSSIIESL